MAAGKPRPATLGSAQTRIFRQRKHHVHVLDSRSAGPLCQVVDGADDHDPPPSVPGGHLYEIRARHMFRCRQVVDRMDKWRIGITLSPALHQSLCLLVRADIDGRQDAPIHRGQVGREECRDRPT